MQGGDVVLQAADGGVAGRAEGAAGAKGLEHVVTLGADDAAAGEGLDGDVGVGGQAQGRRVGAPISRLTLAQALGGAAAGDLHRIGGADRIALAGHDVSGFGMENRNLHIAIFLGKPYPCILRDDLARKTLHNAACPGIQSATS